MSPIPPLLPSLVSKLSEPLNDDNWTAWRDRMTCVLRLCGIKDYADGKILRPENAQEASNWDFNDNYAQVLIVNNVTSAQMVHVGQCETACAMWSSLEAVHEPKGRPQTIITLINILIRTSAEESEDLNVSEHLGKLKSYREQLNSMGDDSFTMSDTAFKVLIAGSLPSSWDAFTSSYVGSQNGTEETDPRKLVSSQEFIGILRAEYLHRMARAQREIKEVKRR